MSRLRNKQEILDRLAERGWDAAPVHFEAHEPKQVLGSREEWELLAGEAPAADQGWGKFLHRALNTSYLLASDPSETGHRGLSKRHYFGSDGMFICAVWYERKRRWLLVKAETLGRVKRSWATWGDGTVPEHAAIEYVLYPHGHGEPGDQLGLMDEVVEACWEWASALRTSLELEDEGWGEAPALADETLEWLAMRSELGFGRIAKADSDWE